jgi:hypothetical protein
LDTGGNNGPETNRRPHQAQQRRGSWCVHSNSPIRSLSDRGACCRSPTPKSTGSWPISSPVPWPAPEGAAVHPAPFEYAKQYLLTDAPVNENRQLLVGAYFTQEYALESAALFNPSMVWHPDQTNVPPGSKRFILSLRATGEGHVSSITFRSGVIDGDCKIVLDPTPRFVTTPDMEPNTEYDKSRFSACRAVSRARSNRPRRWWKSLHIRALQTAVRRCVASNVCA